MIADAFDTDSSQFIISPKGAKGQAQKNKIIHLNTTMQTSLNLTVKN
jgi:hypothetical protein